MFLLLFNLSAPFLIEIEGDKDFKSICTCLEFPFCLAGCETSETDSDEIISAKSLLMTTANISYKSHRRRCVIAHLYNLQSETILSLVSLTK